MSDQTVPERYERAAEAIAAAARTNAKALRDHGSSAYRADLAPSEFHDRALELVKYWDWQDELLRREIAHE